ncbi:MAG: hypothetical protein A4E56_01619 [Pelotomaculum sp. PtaU1.Bin065]|nr:MAG: hypothetical protein A4E56_03354 [Pelotomaculum sp. PtaU1.Bin065]OPY60374.1 MAG: hypothetical protein A4E56_02740 [Pelotomaculum sp. PtaU1.Bin065]OPY61509.1 MAG: hypothetical protein A4E56_01983 [Pelotomaculum sp. PtaU1.Bin065]OPY61994.1 MAG: hypothetical protein A4E56_01619 [Pelotomaculum sp. PtaU1.Bin065]
MFIRWKGPYAYLEQRYTAGGKVKSKSRYLGQNPLEALERMMDNGEINRHEYDKLAKHDLEGVLRPTLDGCLGINDNFGFLEKMKIAVFFNERWLPGSVEKNKNRWLLKDDSGNIICLCPGMKVRQLF